MKSLWTCLHFFDLPLAVFARGDVRERPTVVSSISHRPDVVAANGAAQRRGIAPGMSIAAALALDAELSIHLRDERAEAATLKSIALWAGQWTPTISIELPACVLMEIAGCRAYFGGFERLRKQIDSGLAAIGFSAVVATAPTASAASLLARGGRAIAIENGTDLAPRLANLRVALLEHAQGALDTLAGIGAHTLGDVRALPRYGVARRFGQALLDEIDRALGHLPDARPLFVAPARYHGQIELPSPVEETEALLFAAKRLVTELAGFLQGRGAGVTRLRCDLVHEDEQPTSIVLGLAPTRRIEHIMNVLRERLARQQLPDRVEAIRVVSEEIAPLVAKKGDFFAGAGKDSEAGAQLVERLRARLGDDAVQALSVRADHRPERAWGQTAAISDEASTAKNNYGQTPMPLRPLWLLPEPRPLGAEPAATALQLLSGPERIETGWWDGGDIGRDYFVGRGTQGEELWLYRDRGGQWFVHGVFA
ncbi:MAG: DNA polymerase Y family protein [Casimicrobiaceae bacterium]